LLFSADNVNKLQKASILINDKQWQDTIGWLNIYNNNNNNDRLTAFDPGQPG